MDPGGLNRKLTLMLHLGGGEYASKAHNLSSSADPHVAEGTALYRCPSELSCKCFA